MATNAKENGSPAPLEPLSATQIRQGWPWLESTHPTLSSHRNTIVCLLLAVVTVALYSPTFGHPFIVNYDDDNYVIHNSHVTAGLTWQTLTWALTSTDFSNWHPLTWLSHALDCQLYDLNPTGHHVSNVLLHMFCVILLFLLLVRATGAAGRSFLVAALFAVHPFNVESVAWIAERKNVLSTFFFLLSLGTYGWYALKPSLQRYLTLVAFFVLGLAAKPMVITLPCVLLLLDYWPLRRLRPFRQSLQTRGRSSKDPGNSSQDRFPLSAAQASLSRLVVEKLPLFALSAAEGVVTIFAQRSWGSMHFALPLGVRLENAVYAYAMYIWKAFWPARLAVFYPHPGAALTKWQFALAAVFLLAVSGFIRQQRASRPYLVVGWLWFLGTLVPVIGLVQVGEQAMADRYAYVPLIGIFLMAVWGAADLADYVKLASRTRSKVAAAVLVVYALFTVDQIRYWRSAVDLWAHTVEVTKGNYAAEEQLGAALLMSDRANEAVAPYRHGVVIRPWDPMAHLNLGVALTASSQTREAISEIEEGISLHPDPKTLAGAYQNLGGLYSQTGNYAKARASYEAALRLSPDLEIAREGLNELNFAEALRDAAESPSGQTYSHLGQVLQQSGRVSEARTAYEHALDLDPKSSEARQALRALGEPQK